MDQYKVNLKGVVSWSFEFEDQEWFAGFRELATHGVDKPVLNVFRMFSLMDGQRVSVHSDGSLVAGDIIASGVRDKNDIYSIASKNGNSASVLVWNYHDDDIPGPASEVSLVVRGLEASKVLVHHYRIDNVYSNSFEKWKSMGRPQSPTPEQYAELERSGQLQLYTSPSWTDAKNGVITLTFPIPRQGVSFIKISW